ncbi:MAG: hypothetical protein EXX96DRAFT_491893 [Benjaminiella poitrasii]|nr:MAG: hypothetical protein EXX96DRAFT_491893 [Benjaminiella poitrasii]
MLLSRNNTTVVVNHNIARQPSSAVYYPERPFRPQPGPPQPMMTPQLTNAMPHYNRAPYPNSTYYGPPPPPPPPNHMMMQPMMRPPPPPPSVNFMAGPQISYDDTSYLSDSSLSVAHAAGKRPTKQNAFPPFTKENLDRYRQEASNSTDPQATLDLAKFLLEAANQVASGEQEALIQDNKQRASTAKKAREGMIQEAQRLVKKLATHAGMGKQGYAEAQFFLANCYGTGGMGLIKDAEKAFALYVQGSKQSHPGCTFRAAVCYEVGAGTKRDKNHAMQFYRKAANLGDQTAMYKLGMILLKGLLGQPKSPREGISWLKRAAQQADQDHPHALHELGLAYEKEGIPSVIPDLNYARELFSQAAQYGYAPSQRKLGWAYENGFLNCPVDPRRSIAWYSKAAEQGEAEAEFSLSGWYLTGAEGILPQSDTEAYLWARKAADKGNAKAEYAVGYYTETGTGTRQNLDEAKRWYMRAAAQNYRRAMQRLTELKYGGAKPRQRRQHTRDNHNTAVDSKDSECTIM